MATIVLQEQVRVDATKPKPGAVKDQSTTISGTHNNARLFYNGGKCYEFVGLDASGNRIYRAQDRLL